MTDLGSTNGTYLDEEELPPNRAADLYVGSRIVFGEAPPRSMPEGTHAVCLHSCTATNQCWSQCGHSHSAGG